MLSMCVAILGVGCEHGGDLDGKALERSRTSSDLAGFLGATGIAMPVTLTTADSAAWFAAGRRDVPSMADVPAVGDVLGMTEASAPEALNGLGATAARHTYALATIAAAHGAWRDAVPAGKPAALAAAAGAKAVRPSASAAQTAADMSVVRQAAAPTRTYTDQQFARRHVRSRGPSPTEPPA